MLEDAGLRVVTGPPQAAPAAEIEDLVRRHRPSAILTCWAPISAAAISASASLRIVARMGVGLDNIDVPAATEHGVLVTNVPDYCVPEVSDHAVAFVLAWTRGLVAADREVRAGHWNPSAAGLRRLSALTCGVVGLGRIGRATATKLRALGTHVIAATPESLPDTDIEIVALDELLAASDVVVLHAPLTPQTRHLIGAREFALMRPGALLVNPSRGGLVDTNALIAALHSGQLGGAGLDVLEDEPSVPPGLLDHPAVVITPHIAFSSDASVVELRRSAAAEVIRVLRGEPPRHPQNHPSAISQGAPQ
ncbi:C-terminal binding protein [Nocardia sp. NEAU-G5]|uniref:C-terminal binding protein n=2 Tax=Nocardia albiluteola TaxID=2842303 RepID=A0ABS6AYQ5_9NOCA|nr:C-terminal binding protein [Nocardia albiluteola]